MRLESVIKMAKRKKKRLSKIGKIFFTILALLIIGLLLCLAFTHQNLFNKEDQTPENNLNISQNVDTEKPKITYVTNMFRTKVGNEVDLLKDVTATDNSNEILTVSIEGDYDFGISGTYKLKYAATDSSGNKAEEDFILKVYIFSNLKQKK